MMSIDFRGMCTDEVQQSDSNRTKRTQQLTGASACIKPNTERSGKYVEQMLQTKKSHTTVQFSFSSSHTGLYHSYLSALPCAALSDGSTQLPSAVRTVNQNLFTQARTVRRTRVLYDDEAVVTNCNFAWMWF